MFGRMNTHPTGTYSIVMALRAQSSANCMNSYTLFVGKPPSISIQQSSLSGRLRRRGRVSEGSIELNVYNYMEVKNQHSVVNLKHFASLMATLALEACNAIRLLGNDPMTAKYSKGIDDPVTEADYKIQTIIMKALKMHFPRLAIVGEESVDYKGVIDIDFQKLPLSNCPEGMNLSEQVPVQELVVFIDPIDGTKSFISKNFDAVTVLIGLSRNNRAYLGVIGSPYKINNEQLIYDPEVFLGAVETSSAFSSRKVAEWVQLGKHDIQKPMRVVVSGSRSTNQPQDKLTSLLKCKVIEMSGSGKKMLMVIRGEADAHVYWGAANHSWDSCAGEAIISAMGGLVLTPKGQHIQYHQDDIGQDNYLNRHGLVTSFDSSIIETIFEIAKQHNL